jgi:hypothetical protein
MLSQMDIRRLLPDSRVLGGLLPGSPYFDSDGVEFVTEGLQFADLKSDRAHREKSQDLFANLVGYFFQQLE